MIGPICSPEDFNMKGIRIMDFNVHPKRLTDPVSSMPIPSDRSYTVVTEETHVGASIFEEAVTTSLPYAVTVRQDFPPAAMPMKEYNGVMIDREQIIGVGFPSEVSSPRVFIISNDR